MRRLGARVPVHLLLDLDHTLVHPLYRPRTDAGADAPTGSGGEAVGTLAMRAPQRTLDGPWAFDYSGGRIAGVRLRPHAVPFLAHVLLDHALDTEEVEVRASLYTRQSAAYCAAVAQQVLLPALALHRGQPCGAGEGAGRVFDSLHGGEWCVRGGGDTLCWPPAPHPTAPLEGDGDGSPPAAPSTAATADAPTELEWCKSVFVSPSPLTTLLIDDRSVNFRAAELRTGRGVLVPSYRADLSAAVAGAAMDDGCFRVTDSLIDLLPGGPADEYGSEAPRVLDLLEAFVQCCHFHRHVVRELHDALMDIGASASSGGVVPLTASALDGLLDEFNVFALSPAYRRRWNAFHADRDNELHACFSRAAGR